MHVYEERQVRLRGLLDAEGVDLAVIGPTANMRYFLGGSPFGDERFCALFVDGGGVRVVVPGLNAEAVSPLVSALPSVELFTWEDAAGPDAAIEAAVRAPIGTMGVDGSMRADFLIRLLGLLRPREARNLDPIVHRLRKKKSAEEIETLARSAAQADRVVEAVTALIKPGVTERSLAWEAEKAFRGLGAERVSFTLVAFGEHSAHPHHGSGEKALARGECVLLDIGASLDGYQSDITRMAFLGEPPGEFVEVYGVVREALRAGREAVKPGVPLGDVDRAARSVIEERGYGERFIHRTGHGIGLDVHEAPWVTAGNGEPVEEGMVFSVEPGVYLPGEFGIRIEDIVAAGPAGSRTLTLSTHDLVVL